MATVPKKYSGKWIAWNSDQTKILASAGTLREAREAINESKEEQPIFAKVPQADVRFVGVV